MADRSVASLPILRCPCGAPVRYATKGELIEAILDPEWTFPDVSSSCLFCGPAGRARARASA